MANDPGAEVLHFTCPQCGAALSAPAARTGETVGCPTCYAGVRVPVPPTAEAPAPSVVAQVTTAPPAEAPPAAVPVAGEATIPVVETSAPLSVAATPAEIPAQGMNVSSDPTALAAPPPDAGAQDEQAPGTSAPAALRRAAAVSPLRYRRITKDVKPPKSHARKVVVVVAALVILGVAAAIGKSVADGMERNRIEQDVKALVENGEAAFTGGDVSAAAEQAQKAQGVLDASPQPLDAGLVKQWQGRIAHFQAMKAESEQLQAIYTDAEKDPSAARTRLQDKRAAYGAVTPDNQPVVAKVEDLLLGIGKLELKRKQQKLHDDLQATEALYKDGKIEDAGSRAGEIAQKLAEKPAVQDSELEKRLSVLRKRAEQLKAANDIRVAARGDTYAEAKRKLQAQLDALDENNADLKPLWQRIAALRNDLVLQEKRGRKITAAEAKKLQEIAGFLAGFVKGVAPGTVEGDAIGLTYDGKPLRMGFQRSTLGVTLFVEASSFRFQVEPTDIFGRQARAGVPGKPPRPARVLAHAVALGLSMQKAGVPAEETWSAAEEAPLVSARRTGDDGKEYIFLGDRLYTGQPLAKTASEKEVEADFAKKAEALETAVLNDAPSRDDVRRVIAVAIHASYKDADWFDHLPGDFVRKVINEGYIEKNLPGTAERLKKQLDDYREAYAKISHPGVRFRGTTPQGDEAEELRTFEEHAIWRLYDKAANLTSFAIKNPDDERGCLFVLHDFPGKPDAFPAATPPKTVRMSHQAVGVTATCDVASGKITWDQATWDRAVLLENHLIPDDARVVKGFGPPAWSLPPHVLFLDMMGNTKSMVTPYGGLDIQDFSKIADKASRAAAMDAFVKKIAQVLPSADYLHLYFRYLYVYILDSPITSLPDLLGSRAHAGDIHQTTFESLQRLMGGRYIGDCDDLAECYMTFTRRQNKLSYVMALPQHAACGWAEKPPQSTEYTFYVLDTGPPRIFKDPDLEKVIEKAFRAYDDDKTMRFDPKSLGFLFRFAGEPTRSPYFLSSRMYVDPVYGDIMERVQGYWHFHFYALGIQTMTDMIEKKNDRVPENCVELAGLYGQVREVESSIHWTQEALKQLGPQDKLSRMSEEFRIALMWRQERNNEKAYDAIKGLVAELKQLQSDPQSLNYLSVRLEAMSLLIGIDRPWEAWDVVARDMQFFKQRGALKIEHAGGLTSAYEKMQELIRKGKQPTQDEKDKLKSLEDLLAWFYQRALFEREDDFNDYMRKYAFVGLWYAGKFGHERLVVELLKDGPFPDPTKPRNHTDRRDPAATEAEDWKWIRLALPSYSMAIGDALDLDDPPEKWRRDEAAKLAEAMTKAAEHARQFGSLSQSEFQLLTARVFRAFLVKDWADLDKVLAIVAERNWARLTADTAETFGRGARFVTPDEFVQQYRLFTKQIKARTAYFTVIYEAYRADGIQHAVQATKVALECWPGDEDMKREAQYLEELARKKLAKAKPGPK